MLNMFKKLVRLNLDDLLLYLGVEGGLFLLIQIIIGCVMHFGRPDTSVTVACILFPIVGGFTALYWRRWSASSARPCGQSWRGWTAGVLEDYLPPHRSRERQSRHGSPCW